MPRKFMGHERITVRTESRVIAHIKMLSDRSGLTLGEVITQMSKGFGLLDLTFKQALAKKHGSDGKAVESKFQEKTP
jgi:hypothetical protein